MSTLLSSVICKVDAETRLRILQTYQVNERDLERDVKILIEWHEKQPHLPSLDICGSADRRFLEMCLMRTKFHLEATKEKLDKFYTIRGCHRQTFRSIPLLLPSQCAELILVLPELNERLERVVIVKANPLVSYEQQDVMQLLKHICGLSELYFRQDYCVAWRVLQDFHGMTFAKFRRYAPKMSPFSLMYQEIYFGRVHGIEYINVPPFLEVFLQALKKLLNPILFERITVHHDFKSLHRNLSAKYLPKDYGGDLLSCDEYVHLMDTDFQRNFDALQMAFDQVSDESKRITPTTYSVSLENRQCFGVDGTFKQLNLD